MDGLCNPDYSRAYTLCMKRRQIDTGPLGMHARYADVATRAPNGIVKVPDVPALENIGWK